MAGMSRLTAIHLAILALACTGPVSSASDRPQAGESQAVLVGTVIHVYDGDTVTVRLDSGPIIVRLHSIDTPEHDQPWGPQAKSALASRVQGQPVSLRVVTQDSYDRLVADVFLGDESINAWMVQQGDAWAYRHYLEDGIYCTWEGEARAARRGIWSQPPDTWRAPWQWRAAQRGEALAYSDYSHETVANCIAAMPSSASQAMGGAAATAASGRPAPAQAPSGDCLIKGNISSKGRIYHLPGSESYEKTQISESKGERWFCTESEARAAGWRPAGSNEAAKP